MWTALAADDDYGNGEGGSWSIAEWHGNNTPKERHDKSRRVDIAYWNRCLFIVCFYVSCMKIKKLNMDDLEQQMDLSYETILP